MLLMLLLQLRIRVFVTNVVSVVSVGVVSSQLTVISSRRRQLQIAKNAKVLLQRRTAGSLLQRLQQKAVCSL